MTADPEKQSPIPHHEDPTFRVGSEDSFAELAAEVRYGYAGVRGIFASPYVFGAALLASMGGFSYGYGTKCTASSIETCANKSLQTKESFRYSWSCRNSGHGILGYTLQRRIMDSILV